MSNEKLEFEESLLKVVQNLRCSQRDHMQLAWFETGLGRFACEIPVTNRGEYILKRQLWSSLNPQFIKNPYRTDLAVKELSAILRYPIAFHVCDRVLHFSPSTAGLCCIFLNELRYQLIELLVTSYNDNYRFTELLRWEDQVTNWLSAIILHLSPIFDTLEFIKNIDVMRKKQYTSWMLAMARETTGIEIPLQTEGVVSGIEDQCLKYFSREAESASTKEARLIIDSILERGGFPAAHLACHLVANLPFDLIQFILFEGDELYHFLEEESILNPIRRLEGISRYLSRDTYLPRLVNAFKRKNAVPDLMQIGKALLQIPFAAKLTSQSFVAAICNEIENERRIYLENLMNLQQDDPMWRPFFTLVINKFTDVHTKGCYLAFSKGEVISKMQDPSCFQEYLWRATLGEIIDYLQKRREVVRCYIGQLYPDSCAENCSISQVINYLGVEPESIYCTYMSLPFQRDSLPPFASRPGEVTQVPIFSGKFCPSAGSYKMLARKPT